MEVKKRHDSLVLSLMGLAILVGTAIFVFTLMGGTKKEAEVKVTDGQIVITGQYGITYQLTDVSDIQLKDDIPAIGRKTNGAGLGEIKKGDFMVDGLGKCRLFIHKESGPYIYLTVGDGYTIINFGDPAKTTAVYEELKNALGR